MFEEGILSFKKSFVIIRWIRNMVNRLKINKALFAEKTICHR